MPPTTPTPSMKVKVLKNHSICFYIPCNPPVFLNLYNSFKNLPKVQMKNCKKSASYCCLHTFEKSAHT